MILGSTRSVSLSSARRNIRAILGQLDETKLQLREMNLLPMEKLLQSYLSSHDLVHPSKKCPCVTCKKTREILEVA